MFGSPYKTNLNFTKVISGISKTLNVANQVIPLYKEARPMINNAKTILNTLKDFSKTRSNSFTNTIKNDITKTKVISSNNPKFFL